VALRQQRLLLGRDHPKSRRATRILFSGDSIGDRRSTTTSACRQSPPLRSSSPHGPLAAPVISTRRSRHLDERFRIDPLAQLLLKLQALVDFDLAILGDPDADPLERPRRRTFEVDAVDIEPGAVTGALELLLPLQPTRRAAEVRADRGERVNQVPAVVGVGVNDPNAAGRLELLRDA